MRRLAIALLAAFLALLAACSPATLAAVPVGLWWLVLIVAVALLAE